MMNALAWIGEARIAQALQDGELDNLPGAGKPLHLNDVRDPALDAQVRLGLELLERACHAQASTARDRCERAVLRLLWAKALDGKRRRVPGQFAPPASLDRAVVENGTPPHRGEVLARRPAGGAVRGEERFVVAQTPVGSVASPRR